MCFGSSSSSEEIVKEAASAEKKRQAAIEKGSRPVRNVAAVVEGVQSSRELEEAPPFKHTTSSKELEDLP